MIYLSGGGHRLIDLYGTEGLGIMLNPRTGYHVSLFSRPWAAENDCFNQGQDFDWDHYAQWLHRLDAFQRTNLFVPAPDVVADSVASLKRSIPYLSLIRILGYPAALVGQDGLLPDDIPWDELDVLFIGGSTQWKLSAAARHCVEAAIERGKPVHMGRVNSERRFRIAYEWGCATVDGTYLKYGPDTNWPSLKKWLRINGQGILSLR